MSHTFYEITITFHLNTETFKWIAMVSRMWVVILDFKRGHDKRYSYCQ